MERDSENQQLTVLLKRWNEGGIENWNELLSTVYRQLHRKASQMLSANQAMCDVNATLLVNELYLKYHNKPEVNWQNREHFFAHAALTLRGLLLDTIRRNPNGQHTQLTTANAAFLLPSTSGPEVEIMALEKAMQRLEKLNAQWCRVIEFRFLLGLSIEEVAQAMSISEASVNNYWALARRWLQRQLNTIETQ